MDFFTNHKNSCKVIFLTWMCFALLCCDKVSTTYKSVSKLYDDILGPNSGYNPGVRPLEDQKKRMIITVTFDIIAIIEIDPIKQKFIVNGFLSLNWMDEVLQWNTSDYDGAYILHPYPSQIWRPRLILGNTLEKRDLFEDDYCPTLLLFNGFTSWNPGSLFPTSCKLDLRKYPFDTQTCYIHLLAMGWLGAELHFLPTSGVVNTTHFSESGEWEVSNTSIEASNEDDNDLPAIKISFVLKRLPGFFIINIVTPIVLMSFLNILVFLIPVESGEKISYGITVLLALTVFMSFVSSQVPRSSDTIPLVSIYLLVLTIISVCTVIVTIAIVFCHHYEEKETKRKKATSTFKGMFHKVQILNNAASKLTQVQPADTENSSEKNSLGETNKMKEFKRSFSSESAPVCQGDRDAYVNRWKQIGKHLDLISFVFFMLIWVFVTVGFMVEMSK